MSSGPKGIPGVWKARTGKKGVETMMTELDKLRVDDMLHRRVDRQRNQLGRSTNLPFPLWEITSDHE